jgi:hypothetical protein
MTAGTAGKHRKVDEDNLARGNSEAWASRERQGQKVTLIMWKCGTKLTTRVLMQCCFWSVQSVKHAGLAH